MKILISGDSWGCGEWRTADDPNGQGINHKGLEQYLLEDNHTVQNISQGGYSLYDILQNLNFQNEKYDYVFVFVTDAHRLWDTKNFWIPSYTYQDYLLRYENYVKAFVNQLDQLDIGPIKLIGGLTKCKLEYTKNTNIEIAIPSIFELLTEKNHYDMCFHEHYQTLNTKNINKETLDKVYEQTKILDDLFINPIFHPDGRHPNRQGHYKIYKTLCDKYFNTKDLL